MFEASAFVPAPPNEPTLTYAPGSPERAALKAELKRLAGEQPDIPHVIGGRDSHVGAPFEVRSPHAHARVLARAHHGRQEETERAIASALAAAPAWSNASFEERARVFIRAAELAAGPWRQTLNASTMLGQSKNVVQAEIDAACESIDFLRFNVHFGSRLWEQPRSAPGFRNVLECRPLEGFVLAITPFNFTAIALNIPAAPALMGNVVVWKPAETQSLAAYHTMQLLRAAGLPDGVINVVYGEGKPVADTCLANRHLAGIHFTGSTRVFQDLWRGVGERISTYRTYPRLVGETGGKDFVLAHPSARLDELAVALIRGAFEYQGQKCSAASRAYIPRSMWPRLEEKLRAHVAELRVGDVADFRTFMGAVIDGPSYGRLEARIEQAKQDPKCRVLTSSLSRDEGWFVGPTLVEVSDPAHPLMQDELFGPVLSLHVYPDEAFDETLKRVDQTGAYALTGAIWAEDRAVLTHAARTLRQAAGNLYLNDKPTGAVVGQQPFGGARQSGTNDKAGSPLNLLRWVSPRTVKETFHPDANARVAYPSMDES